MARRFESQRSTTPFIWDVPGHATSGVPQQSCAGSIIAQLLYASRARRAVEEGGSSGPDIAPQILIRGGNWLFERVSSV